MTRFRALPLVAVLALPISVLAEDSSTLVLESDGDQTGGADFSHLTFDTLADFIADNPTDSGFSSLDLGPSWDIGGFAFDGDRYYLIQETSSDQPSGSEVFFYSFVSIADLVLGAPAASGFSFLDIDPLWSIGGFASDGGQYHLILETDDDQSSGAEVRLLSYDSLLDFLLDDRADSGFSELDVDGLWDIGGFAADGDQYHVVIESQADRPGGEEVFYITYDSIADFLSDDGVAFDFSNVDVPSDFGIGGFSGPVPLFADGSESGDMSAWSSTGF